MPPAYVVVTLHSGGRFVRRVADEHGRFSFAGLAPGRWEITVDDRDLPDLHRVENGGGTVDLAPGEDTNVTLQVVPVHRVMRWIGGGTVPSANPSRLRIHW